MKVADISGIESGSKLEADLAIVGSGPAGLAIARRFAGTRVRVLVLESGGLDEGPEAAELNALESTGATRRGDQREVRNRVFGGTTHTWSGRCRTFDDIDFERRDWVPFSGWPIGPEDLAPYEDAAGQLLNLGPHVYDQRLWPQLGMEAPEREVRTDILRPCFWQYARDPERPMDFLHAGREALKMDAPNIRVLTGATVTHIDTEEGGRKLSALEVATRSGDKVTVTTPVVVLAAGGIENARLLLASNRQHRNGLGNEHDLVGRFLMDHPRTTIADFRVGAAEAVQARFGTFQLQRQGKAHFYTYGLALAPELQRREGLLNCAAFLTEHRAVDDPWDAIKRIYSRKFDNVLRDTLAIASSPGLVVDGVRRRVLEKGNVPHKLDRLVVDCLVEQVPDRDSRVTLSDARDPLGVPRARVHWKVSELEKRSAMRLAQVFAGEVGRMGLEQPTLAAWVRNNRPDEANFIDVAHPTGTTRMADDPSQGVVDRHCGLHGVDGVYIAGSSVFPTSGHANPTQMIVTLALRLADRLKQVHFGG